MWSSHDARVGRRTTRCMASSRRSAEVDLRWWLVAAAARPPESSPRRRLFNRDPIRPTTLPPPPAPRSHAIRSAMGCTGERRPHRVRELDGCSRQQLAVTLRRSGRTVVDQSGSSRSVAWAIACSCEPRRAGDARAARGSGAGPPPRWEGRALVCVSPATISSRPRRNAHRRAWPPGGGRGRHRRAGDLATISTGHWSARHGHAASLRIAALAPPGPPAIGRCTLARSRSDPDRGA